MQFVKPMPFEEALQVIGNKTPIGSAMVSSEWSDVPVALRERAFFSSEVENIRFLQRGLDFIDDFLSGAREQVGDATMLKAGSRAEFVDQLREFALSEGMGPLDPKDAGSIKDITSESRLSLVFNTVTQQADDYGYYRQGMDPDVLDEFPAQRFIRVKEVKTERELHIPYEDQVFLKTDPIWAKVINHDFGVPWGPWGWGCGHDVQDEDRAAAEELGLIKPGQKLEPEVKNFNENLKASASGLEPELLEKLKKDLGDQLVVKDDELSWRSAPDVKSQIANSQVTEPPKGGTPSLETLDAILSRLGLDSAKEATPNDMIALRNELKEADPVKQSQMIKSITGASEDGVFTDEKIRDRVQQFLDYIPKSKALKLPKLQLEVDSALRANGEYAFNGTTRFNSKLSEQEAERVSMHELMHWFHIDGDKAYRDAIQKHFAERTAGDRILQLRGYKRGVKGLKDDWYEMYAGRVYPQDMARPQGLEVPTRYIEWLTMDPKKMAQLWNDETFRETMVIVLKGLF